MRAVWTGSLSFGLINIPVKMYNGENPQSDLKFNLLDKKTHSKIRYARISRKTGEEVPYEDIVKGYEYQDGDYIILTDEDFKKANRQRQKTVDIKAFVDEEEIDKRYFKKPYYLEPEKGAENAYALLLESLRRAKKMAVAKYVLHNRDHIAAIGPIGRVVTLFELRFLKDVREPTRLNLPDQEAASDEQVKMALALIDQLSKHFIPEDYHDTYEDEMREIIEQKAKGRPVKAKGKEKAPTQTEDIMDMLKASLDKAGSKERTSKKKELAGR
ncbi:Ku protein [Candidatus Parcubacteria bacterium]|nr:Ku protein [Candidatus Parcubacteria bacterium]